MTKFKIPKFTSDCDREVDNQTTVKLTVDEVDDGMTEIKNVLAACGELSQAFYEANKIPTTFTGTAVKKENDLDEPDVAYKIAFEKAKRQYLKYYSNSYKKFQDKLTDKLDEFNEYWFSVEEAIEACSKKIEELSRD